MAHRLRDLAELVGPVRFGEWCGRGFKMSVSDWHKLGEFRVNSMLPSLYAWMGGLNFPIIPDT